MIKTYKNKVTNIKAVHQSGNIYKVIDSTEDIDTSNIVMFLSGDQIKNSKYWEEVIEQEYEITSFRMDTWKSLVLTLRENGEYVREDKPLNWGGHSLETMLRDCSIESVKRLSDSVVFTVGDKVCWDWSACSSDYFTIDGFKIIDGEMRAMIRLSANCVTDYKFFDTEKNEKYNFRHYVEEKKADFITEDGIGVDFGADIHWVMNYSETEEDYGYLYKTHLDKGHPTLIRSRANLYKVFSTEEAARKFVGKTELIDVKLTKEQVVKLKELLK